jgi:hypothetical protein
MAAAGTKAARRKSIPRRTATVVKIFRIMAVGTVPAVRVVGLPLAQRATNTVEIGSLFISLAGPGGLRGLNRFLEEPERYRDAMTGTGIVSIGQGFLPAHGAPDPCGRATFRLADHFIAYRSKRHRSV